jgi:hypothetical protein
MFKKILFALPLVVLITACKKKVDPVPATPLTGICYPISLSTNGSSFLNIIYDSNNRLDSLVIPKSNTSSKIKYNSNGRLIKNIGYSGSTDTSYYSYHYDVNGRNDKDTLFLNTGSFVADSAISYTYNIAGQITRTDGKGVISGNTGYILYTYDTDGNMILEQDYNGTILFQTISNTYDTKSWPFSVYPEIVASTQKHNILSKVVKDNTGTVDIYQSYTATYTYNNNNYPLTETYNYQGGFSYTTTYNYTCK